MSQLPQNLPVSRDQVLDEVEFLLTVEHALIVEYLSVRCALGYDLDTAHGGPVNGASREAAAEADSQADLLMLKVGRVVRALYGVRTVTALGRAGQIADTTGAVISLEPPAASSWSTCSNGQKRSRPPWTRGTRGWFRR